jgi:hypothetical protein
VKPLEARVSQTRYRKRNSGDDQPQRNQTHNTYP